MKTTIKKRTLSTLAATALALVAMALTPVTADNTGTGGTITFTDASGLNPRSSPPYPGGYVIHTFTSSGTLNIPEAASADYLVVGGGGGGGMRHGGGGGAGGLLAGSTNLAAQSYTVTVGAGGAGANTSDDNLKAGSPGANSVFGAFTAIGGGGGRTYSGSYNGAGGSGGGGSGGGSNPGGGTGISGQGRDGGSGSAGGANGGGGGGAGELGGASSISSGGKGGNGVQLSISGVATYYAGGGGGGGDSSRTGGAGGLGGGGHGGDNGVNTNQTAGTNGTGGGGGGCRSFTVSAPGSAGGSGIVIVRYALISAPVVSTLNPTDNATGFASDGNLVVTFNQDVLKGTGNIEIKKTSDNSVLETIDVTSGLVSVSGNSATIDPSVTLPLGTECYVQIAAGAFTEISGPLEPFAGIIDTTTWSFTTAGGTPVIATLNPADNATLAADTDNLVVTFDQTVLKGTGNIVVKKTSDDSVVETINVTSGLVTVSGTSATINPSANLPLGTEYYVQIAAGAFTAAAGAQPAFAGITDTTTWSFTTVGTPLVATLNPVDDAIDISPSANLVVTFDQAVLKGTGNIEIKKTSDDSVVETIDVTSGLVTVSGSQATINPAAFLPLATECYVQIAAGAFTATVGSLPAFAGITDTTTWSFTTVSTLDLTWDANGSIAAQTDGTGIWLSANQWWNGSANTDWYNDPANPGNATIGVGGAGGTITLGAVNAGSVTFAGFSGTYTLSGGSLTQSGGITVAANSGAVAISSSIIGAGNITKNNPGQLTLSGANSSFTGDIIINAGSMEGITAAGFGTGTNIIFTGPGTLQPAYGVSPVLAKSIAVNPGGTATLNVPNQFYHLTFTGPVSNSGTLKVTSSDNGNGSVTLSNAANTFTGTLEIGTTIYGLTLNVNSLADSANRIKFYGTSSKVANFNLAGGTAAPLLFDSRSIELLGGTGASASINNNNATPANTITINTDLIVTSTGAKTLTLGGSNTGANTFGGDIANGVGSVISLTKAGAGLWILSGANTYSGNTTVNSGGALTLASTGGLTFVLTNATSNKITGAGSAILNGNFTINRSAVSVTSGSWTLVDVATRSFGSNFNVVGFENPDIDNTWELVDGNNLWIFDTVSGTLSLSGLATAGYAAWTLGPFLETLTDTDPALDFDNGGLPTGIEWVVGGDPTDPSDDVDNTPTFDNTTDPDKFLFSYRRTDAALADGNTSIKVEYGSDLSGWTPALHQGPGPAQITVTVDDNFYGISPGIDKVTVAIPRSLATANMLYGRLNVVVTQP